MESAKYITFTPNGTGSTELTLIKGLKMTDAAKLLTSKQNGRQNLDDSFYICDLGDIAMKYEVWTKQFPRIRPFFAVKSGPHAPMMKCLSAMGGAFDCASQKEIDLAMRCGAAANDIVYANPNKQISHILHAKKLGIKLTVFDRSSELRKMKEHFPDCNLLLRIRTDSVNSVVVNPYVRFGATVEKSKELLNEAKKMNLNVVGISFHVGTGCTKPAAYVQALESASTLFLYAKDRGMQFTILNIGGGFPGSEETPCPFRKIADVVNSCLGDLFPPGKYKGLELIAEPGRYFSTSAFTLATNVICKSESDDDVEVEYTLNDSVYASFTQLGQNSPGDLEPFLLDDNERVTQISRVWGASLSTIDHLIPKRVLPKMELGEWLFWRNAGTYTFALLSGFNGIGPEKFYDIISQENGGAFNRMLGEINVGRCTESDSVELKLNAGKTPQEED